MLISLIQPNFQQGPKELNAYYLPYTVGVLWSYVSQFSSIKDNYSLDRIIWRREDIETTAQSLKTNDVLAFSTYIWNKNYNYALAKRIKELNPKCITIFGGPEIPVTKKDLFDKHPYMDVVVKGEGEVTFKELLESIIVGGELNNIPGLLLNNSGKIIDTLPRSRLDMLDNIPSPYITGIFDKIMSESEGIGWNSTLETNRGCPYTCTFCDWGSLTNSKVKIFSLERVFAELEWISKNKCGYVTITDANFGIFVERDSAIADKLLSLQDTYGYPPAASITWAKNQKPEVFDIVSKLVKSPRAAQGLTVSAQSMDLGVLKNINRINLKQHKISDIFSMCEKYNVPVYTEMILGLPGESPESWKNGIWQLFRAGNHTGINILHCELLENTEMNLKQREIYDITSIPAYDYMSGHCNEDELAETVDIVTSNADMPFEDMIDTQLFNCFIDTFHISGLTTFISRVLFKEYKIDYATFYDTFYEFLKSDPWFKQEMDELRSLYLKWMTEGKIDAPTIGNNQMQGWNLNHRITLHIHANDKYDSVFELIELFINREFSVDRTLLSQLILFQRRYIINYKLIDKYPYTETFDYDFLGYLRDGSPLMQPATYSFEYTDSKDISFSRFLESIYFGRKRNFGKAVITKVVA